MTTSNDIWQLPLVDVKHLKWRSHLKRHYLPTSGTQSWSTSDHEIKIVLKETWQQEQEAVWCLLRERRCPRCCKICTEEAPDKQYLRSWNEEWGWWWGCWGGGWWGWRRGDEDDGKHDDKDGDVCKDLEQGDPAVLELLGHCFASMVPLSKSVDCPLFFFFSLFKFVFS